MNIAIHNKVRNFFSDYPSRDYSKGQILLHFDEKSDYIFFIESGRVKQYSISNSGSVNIVNIYRKFDMFPICVALVNSSTSYIYESMSEISIRRAPLDNFMNFFENSPDVILKALKDLYKNSDKALKRMTFMASANAYIRIVYEIVNECSYLKPRIDRTYHILMHEYEIAECAGLSRETTSREFKKLIDKKLVKVTRKKIIVKNLKKLKSELESQ